MVRKSTGISVQAALQSHKQQLQQLYMYMQKTAENIHVHVVCMSHKQQVFPPIYSAAWQSHSKQKFACMVYGSTEQVISVYDVWLLYSTERNVCWLCGCHTTRLETLETLAGYVTATQHGQKFLLVM